MSQLSLKAVDFLINGGGWPAWLFHSRRIARLITLIFFLQSLRIGCSIASALYQRPGISISDLLNCFQQFRFRLWRTADVHFALIEGIKSKLEVNKNKTRRKV